MKKLYHPFLSVLLAALTLIVPVYGDVGISPRNIQPAASVEFFQLEAPNLDIDTNSSITCNGQAMKNNGTSLSGRFNGGDINQASECELNLSLQSKKNSCSLQFSASLSVKNQAATRVDSDCNKGLTLSCKRALNPLTNEIETNCSLN